VISLAITLFITSDIFTKKRLSRLEWWFQGIVAIVGYLLGMAFAGSFIGRKWMGIVDISLHKLFKRKINTGKYLYWKHFCGIENPPRPENLKKPKKIKDRILCRLI
jgi:hypothetical protein